jgi:hypothetical protein
MARTVIILPVARAVTSSGLSEVMVMPLAWMMRCRNFSPGG